MHAVYLTTNRDTTTFLSTPLEVQGYVCGIIELDGKVIIPKRLMKNKPKPMPSPPMTPTDEEGKIPLHEELKDQSLEQNNDDDGFTNNLYLCSDIVEEPGKVIKAKRMPAKRRRVTKPCRRRITKTKQRKTIKPRARKRKTRTVKKDIFR